MGYWLPFMVIAASHYLSWGNVVLCIAMNHGSSPHPQPGPADTAGRKEREKNRGEFDKLVGVGRGHRSLDRRSQDACMKGLSCARALPSRALITQ